MIICWRSDRKWRRTFSCHRWFLPHARSWDVPLPPIPWQDSAARLGDRTWEHRRQCLDGRNSHSLFRKIFRNLCKQSSRHHEGCHYYPRPTGAKKGGDVRSDQQNRNNTPQRVRYHNVTDLPITHIQASPTTVTAPANTRQQSHSQESNTNVTDLHGVRYSLPIDQIKQILGRLAQKEDDTTEEVFDGY